jgi:hypothetical protein
VSHRANQACATPRPDSRPAQLHPAPATQALILDSVQTRIPHMVSSYRNLGAC